MDDASGHTFLDPPYVRMPPFSAGAWLNTSDPLTKEKLYGKVVLVDFWDYTCINCLRTLPYLQEWQRRYAGHGLQIIGIHAPEFKFGHFRSVLEMAVEHLNITYPVLLDNDYENWSRFAVKAWPTKFVVDSKGYIRQVRQGEGYYQQIERAVQLLLGQVNPEMEMPPLLSPLRAEDQPGAVCYRPSPEIYAGYAQGALFSGKIGNADEIVPDNPLLYALPETEEMETGYMYLEGIWRMLPESVSFAGEVMGKLVVPYAAAGINAVMAPHPDPLATVLEYLRTTEPATVIVKQDGRFLDPLLAGRDVQIDEYGRSLLLVDEPRMYEIVRNPTFGRHTLELSFLNTHTALYTLSFTSCTRQGKDNDDPNTYVVR